MRQIMRNSEVFKKVDSKTMTISPHIMRTTKVHQVMFQIKEKAIEECRKSIGHTPGSYTINHYLPRNFEISLSLYSNLIEEIDNLVKDRIKLKY